ncbi:MAG: M20/M25/M40 family metallo-hydrolase [Candidatus Kariarchaeaceae archaeon]|jgi:acetylornithine deacetylase/succinyl-diaminopimelate desuccinylase-like protein
MDELTYRHYLEYAPQYEKQTLDLLKELVSFPTVAIRDLKTITECAEYLSDVMTSFGYESKLYPTVPEGSPVVYAEKNVGAEKTLLFYHHYDVQPEDPLDAWDSSPWEMTERGDRIYGRGMADNKGPFTISLLAMKMLEEKLGDMPVNLKFVIEGEEETGSINLEHFTKPNSHLLKADGCIWEFAAVTPSDENLMVLGSCMEFWCGLKGMAYFQLETKDTPVYPNRDIHSGQAGAVPNAAWRMAWALNTLKDEQENILIEGIQELIATPDPDDLEVLQNSESFDEKHYREEMGLDRFLLDRTGLELLSPLYLEPTLSICGLTSGYQDLGVKTIVPSKALAKVDFRLTPNLTRDKVSELLKKHLENQGFGDIDVKLLSGYDPAKTPVKHPFIQLIKKISEDNFTYNDNIMKVNVMPYAPGSGPAYLFAPYTPLIIARNPYGGSNVHAPNENLPRKTFISSLAYNAYIAQQMAKQ